MRVPRVRLRTLMIGIAFLALILTVMMQTVRLRQAVIREERLRAEAEMRRAQAEAALQRSLVEVERLRSTLDQMSMEGRK